MRYAHRLCLFVLLAGLLAGCAGYRLGPAGGESAGAHTIQINPFANKTSNRV